MTGRVELPVTVEKIGGWSDDYFAVVVTTVVVHFDLDRPSRPWRCQMCGRHETPTCAHEIAAENAARKEFQ